MRRLLRDVLLLNVGTFTVVFETLSSSPNPIVMAAGLVCLGAPAATRFERKPKRRPIVTAEARMLDVVRELYASDRISFEEMERRTEQALRPPVTGSTGMLVTPGPTASAGDPRYSAVKPADPTWALR